MIKSKYQDHRAEFLNRYPEDVYYETLSPSGQPVYYKYTFKERELKTTTKFQEVHVSTFLLKFKYKSFLYFWKCLDKHEYMPLLAMNAYIEDTEDPFDVFIETLKKLVDDSDKYINILNEKDILTNKLRTFDGLLYKGQQRHKKIDGLLSEN